MVNKAQSLALGTHSLMGEMDSLKNHPHTVLRLHRVGESVYENIVQEVLEFCLEGTGGKY